MYQRYLLSIFMLLGSVCAFPKSDGTTVSEPTDSVKPEKIGLVKRVIRYFQDSNKPTEEKRVDFSMLGGPAYSGDTKLSVALIGAAVYRSCFRDSLTPVSEGTIYAQGAITGYYQFGIRGTHIGRRDHYRIPYDVSFESYPTYFWGIGYDSDSNDDNKTKFLQRSFNANAALEFRIAENLYVGPAADFQYTKATHIDNDELWLGEPLEMLNYSTGFNLTYDSRDFIANAYSGWYFSLKQRFYPRFLGNKWCFSSTELTLNHYMKGWKGAIIAMQLHGLFTYGDTPWNMLAGFGGAHSMRGYYKRRYIDRNETDVTIELRQHVWKRSSIVVWGGAGNVYPSFNRFDWSHTLPNFGVGYRWEFKKRVNVRFDIGFGRGEKDFIFNLNEVF